MLGNLSRIGAGQLRKLGNELTIIRIQNLTPIGWVPTVLYRSDYTDDPFESLGTLIYVLQRTSVRE